MYLVELLVQLLILDEKENLVKFGFFLAKSTNEVVISANNPFKKCLFFYENASILLENVL